ncbi:MAG: non-ribosomal peptide synthetase, partial [Actinomycetota bacterium]
MSDARSALTAVEVAGELRRRRGRFGKGRRLVCLDPAPTVDRVLDYLAAMDAGHVVLLASSESLASLAATWNPDTIVDDAGVAIRRSVPAQAMHPDLALLLSTSGSTGSPRLVRLSYRNLIANASSIATYLELGPDDVGITSLPLHYCYGLSVLHSHLAAGAAVHLTEASVVDPCFWREVDRRGVTNLAGVPHTFELIERAGIERLTARSLRLVTQAGGRMDPGRVRDLAAFGERCGWELVVMYGQTEATARMAWLPPSMRSRHPDAVGVAVPGGDFEIRDVATDRPVPAGETGRVVYRGPNVMLGYATGHDDLLRGSELDELVTGDLGVIDADGVLRIVGREARFAKLFGLRIDLDRVERRLAADGRRVLVASDDARLAVVVEAAGPDHRCEPASTDEVRCAIADDVVAMTGLPNRVVEVGVVSELPRLPSGKPDAQAAITLVAEGRAGDASADGDSADGGVAVVFRSALGVGDVDRGDTFVSLGGDSLSYVEVSVRLEERLGDLPADWHLTTVAELDRVARDRAGAGRRTGETRRRRWARTDTTVVLRAAAIMLVVSSHMRWHYVP